MNKNIIIFLIFLVIAIILFTRKTNEYYGANCAWSTATKYTADQLADYTPGQSIDSDGACYGKTDITTDFITNGIVPNSNEFIYKTSVDDCYACSVNYPNKVTPGVVCTGGLLNPDCASYTWTGSTMTFTRKDIDDGGYQADKTKCCFNSASTIGDNTCDPNYRSMNSGSCVSQLAATCGTASGFSSNADDCKNFCSVEIQNGKTTCDDPIKTYCASDSGKSDSSCDCINDYSAIETAASEIGQLGDPVCYYSKCLSNDGGSSPLLTKAMANVDCSICNLINNNITAENNSGTTIDITQTCSLGTPSTYDSSSDLSDDSETTIVSWLTDNWVMLTIIAAALIIIIIIIIIITTSK